MNGWFTVVAEWDDGGVFIEAFHAIDGDDAARQAILAYGLEAVLAVFPGVQRETSWRGYLHAGQVE